jgi:diacylglycerol kinase family enzyme
MSHPLIDYEKVFVVGGDGRPGACASGLAARDSSPWT